jgi:hypothetical protein
MALALVATLALALALAAAAPAAARACHGLRISVRVGGARACVKASAPTVGPAAQQRGFDRALFATRLRPTHGSGRGPTIGALLGPARSGLSALEHALAAASSPSIPTAGAASAVPGIALSGRGDSPGAAAGWKTSVQDRGVGDATGQAVAIVARRGGAKLTLESSYVAKAEHCADAAGEDPGTRARKVSLKLAVPLSGGRTLTVTSKQSTTAPFVGTADGGAALAQLKIGKVKTKASASGELRDRGGKLLARLSPTGATATITVPTALGTTVSWPQVLTDPATAFVADGALKAIVRGDGASLDPLLRRFVLQMQTDAWSTYEQARGALLGAQRSWWQAGRCLHLVLEAPGGEKVAAGAHLQLRATAVLTSAPARPRHAGVGPLPISARVDGGAVAPGTATTTATSAGQADPVSFDFTAPARPGTVTATAEIVSKQGTASATLPLSVTATDVYLKVTAVSGHLDYTASYTDGDPVQCTVSGSEHSVAALDPDGHLGPTDGRYRDGSLDLNVPVLWSGAIDYAASGSACSMAPTCHATVAEPGGPVAGGIGSPGAAALDVEIVAPSPHFYSGCVAGYKDPYFAGDIKTISTQVPTATILAGRPFTLTWAADDGGEGHSISRLLTVTATPVDADGNPLG